MEYNSSKSTQCVALSERGSGRVTADPCITGIKTKTFEMSSMIKG